MSNRPSLFSASQSPSLAPCLVLPEKMFVKIDTLYTLDELVSWEDSRSHHKPATVLLGTELCANLPFIGFWKTLSEYETKVSYEYRSGLKHRYGMKCTIMLPCELPFESAADFVRKFMDRFSPDGSRLCYQSFYQRRRKGSYAVIYYTERLYSENGFIRNVCSKGDFYRNLKTGRRCKSDDPNAVLVYKNGDVIRQTLEPFSKKLLCLGTGDHDTFLEFIKYLKGILVDLFRIVKSGIRNGIYIPKINLEKYKRNRFYLKNIVQINRTYSYVETVLSQLYEILNNGYFIDDKETSTAFYKLINRWKAILSQKHFRYNRRLVYFFNINNSWNTVESGLTVIKDQFDDEVSEFYKDYISFDVNVSV